MSKLGEMVKKRELKQKLLSKADMKTFDLLKKSASSEAVSVTCMGLYNHGKSSLLNALIKDVDGETFKTADARQTTQNKAVKHGRYTFVDTPGLNAQDDDDKRVMDAVKGSDINIFVHNVNTGEFVASEVAFFHDIQHLWKDPKVFIERTLFVLSRIDEANRADDILATAKKMESQLEEIFGIYPTIIPVSSLDYLDGLRENEQELIEESNLGVLESKLDALFDSIEDKVSQDRKARFSRYCEGLIQNLHSKAEKTKLKATQLLAEAERQSAELEQDIIRVQETLNQKYSMLEGV